MPRPLRHGHKVIVFYLLEQKLVLSVLMMEQDCEFILMEWKKIMMHKQEMFKKVILLSLDIYSILTHLLMLRLIFCRYIIVTYLLLRSPNYTESRFVCLKEI